MRTVRVLLVVAGLALAGYGGWLLRPQLVPAADWLVAGPLLHDALVAPVVGLAGLALGRLLRDRIWRRWVTAGLVITATLLLIAVPLMWRPHPAPPNPGLQDRDYTTALAIWLAALWTGILAAAALNRALHRLGRADRGDGGPPDGRRDRQPPRPPDAPGPSGPAGRV